MPAPEELLSLARHATDGLGRREEDAVFLLDRPTDHQPAHRIVEIACGKLDVRLQV